jgi:hypothetical protein
MTNIQRCQKQTVFCTLHNVLHACGCKKSGNKENLLLSKSWMLIELHFIFHLIIKIHQSIKNVFWNNWKQALKKMDQIQSSGVIHLKGLVLFQAEHNEIDLLLSGTQTSTAHEKNFTIYNFNNK